MGMSAAAFSRQLGVPTNRVTQIVSGRRSITGDTALRPAHIFGMSAEFWLNLQTRYELSLAEQKSGSAIRPPGQSRATAPPTLSRCQLDLATRIARQASLLRPSSAGASCLALETWDSTRLQTPTF